MKRTWSRRRFLASAMTAIASPAIHTCAAAADEPLLLRCSLETAPAHTRNAVVRDYLGRIEKAAGGKIRTQLFESGQLFPDLQVGKALLQGQIEMAIPGTWSLTGIVPDADFVQLPALYGRPIELIHGVVDGPAGRLLAVQIEQRLTAHVIGPWLDLGFFNWYSTGKTLNGYDDLRGLKIRNNGGAGQAWRTQFMGAIPNTTPLPNVPLALSQGTFDGLITSHETVASGQFWESAMRWRIISSSANTSRSSASPSGRNCRRTSKGSSPISGKPMSSPTAPPWRLRRRAHAMSRRRTASPS